MTRRTVRQTLLVTAAVALGCTGCFGPGNYAVAPRSAPDTIGRGLWRTLGPSGRGRCTAVPPDDPNHPGGPFLWDDSPGPRFVVLRGDEPGFVTEGCLPWFQVPGPFSVPLATPGEPFGQGDYLVGWEVAPGTYRARTLTPMSEDGWPPPCAWVRVRIDSDLRVHYLASGSTGPEPHVGVATIEPGDTYFGSSNCDQWSRID